MRIALLYNPWNLSFRGKWTWDNLYDDPRGMSGSELGFVEIGKALAKAGHRVYLFTDTVEVPSGSWPLGHEVFIYPWEDIPHLDMAYDLAIGINHPGGLESHVFDCPKVCLQWVNSFEYLTRKQIDVVDRWLSPSEGHHSFILEQSHKLQDGVYEPPRDKWGVARLGCTPELYEGFTKVPGRVIHASSPDRGLHHLLHVWPAIKNKCPEAHLRIFYRLRPWIEELKAIPEPFPDIEENRQRALFIEAALERLEGQHWGVEVCGPVSRNRIVQEMAEAEVFAYPVDTLRWSEGFSCTTLEACAAGAVPIIWDCDAMGDLYRGVAEVLPRGNLEKFADEVVRAIHLKKADRYRGAGDVSLTEECRDARIKFAKEHTWQHTAQKILEETPGLKGEEDSSTSTVLASSKTTAAQSST